MDSSSGVDHLDSSLQKCLAAALTNDVQLTINHISTPPKRCEAIFAPPTGCKPQKTYQESHLLALSTVATSTKGQTLIFAIEVYIYTTRSHTVLFVSKADSTGCLQLLGLPLGGRSSPIRCVASAFVNWLVENRQRSGIPTVLSLFARAQNQYLFPGSESNPGKHILTDRQLVRWWCKTLDSIARKDDTEAQQSRVLPHTARPRQAYLIVPGFDEHETAHFFPETWLNDPPQMRCWKYGHPLYNISPYPGAPPRSMVPRFPDDPKTRYVDELDVEMPDASSQHKISPSKRGSGKWKSVQTLETFWEMMAFRQECRSGRLVGFVWIVIQPRPGDLAADSQSSFTSSTNPTVDSLDGSLSPSSIGLTRASPKSRQESMKRKPKRKRLKGPIVPRQPRIKSAAEESSQHGLPESSVYYTWPVGSRGQLLLSQQGYDKLHELLLQLDFTSDEAAMSSTAKWLKEAASVSDTKHEWGLLVQGTQTATPLTQITVQSNGQVNDLTAGLVRKKRKASPSEGQHRVDSIPAINMLGSHLVRKKQKSA